MGVKIREKRGKLYLDIYQEGKRKWEAIGLTVTKDKTQNKEVMRLAEICRSKREMQLLTSAWNLQDPIAGRKKLVGYLEELAKQYTSSRKQTVMNCVHHLKNYENGRVIQIEQMTPQWIEGFYRYLKNDAGLALTSAGLYSRTLRAALKKAVESGIIQKNPADTVKQIHAPESEQSFLNLEEVQRLADTTVGGAVTAEVKRAFLFACQTGLRISDLETLIWDQIEQNPMQIIKRQKKTESAVHIPLSVTALKLLNNGKPHTANVFTLPEGKSRRNTYLYLRKWAEKAGIRKRVSWHTARRTFATLALENGADIYTVAKLLGHTSIGQVAKYAKVTDKLRRNAIAGLPEIKLNDTDIPQNAKQNEQEG
jgi:integrase